MEVHLGDLLKPRWRRVLILTGIIYYAIALCGTLEMPESWGNLAMKAGVDPFWDADLMAMVKWNRWVKAHGIPQPGEYPL